MNTKTKNKIAGVIIAYSSFALAAIVRHALLTATEYPYNTPEIPRDSSILWTLPLLVVILGGVLASVIAFYNPRKSNRVPSPFND